MKRFMLLHFGFEKPTPEIMAAWDKWFEAVADKTGSEAPTIEPMPESPAPTIEPMPEPPELEHKAPAESARVFEAVHEVAGDIAVVRGEAPRTWTLQSVLTRAWKLGLSK